MCNLIWVIRVHSDALGITNAPTTFCTLMNSIFQLHLDVFVVVYLDDILIYSCNMQKHLGHLYIVLELFHKNNLYLNPSKYIFVTKEVDLLCYTIGEGKVHMDEGKVKAIEE